MTVKRCNYFHLITELFAGSVLILSGLLHGPAKAQALIAEVPLKEKPVGAYVDRPGELYLRYESRIVHHDINGKEVGTFTVPYSSLHFEPRDGSRMFIYNNITRQCGFTSFGKIPTTTLPDEYAIEPQEACSAGDNGMWILDRADYSLKRVNLRKGQVDIEFKLPEKLHEENITTLRDYMSFLFLATPAHLYIFSNMGRLLKTLEITASDFDFLGEELYYRKDNRLFFLDLFDGTIRSEEISPEILFVRLTDERRYLIYPNRLVILSEQ